MGAQFHSSLFPLATSPTYENCVTPEGGYVNTDSIFFGEAADFTLDVTSFLENIQFSGGPSWDGTIVFTFQPASEEPMGWFWNNLSPLTSISLDVTVGSGSEPK